MNKITYHELRKSLNFSPNNQKSWAMLLFNVGLFVAATWLFCQTSVIEYLISQVLFAFQFNNSYLIMHETGHYSFFSNRKLNKAVGHFASVFAILPFYSRQFEHSNHHRWVGSFKERSAERGMKAFVIKSKRKMKFLDFLWRLWVPIFAINEHFWLWSLSFTNLDGKKRFWNKYLWSAVFLITPS